MSIYDSERVAAAYAFDRPPVHREILAAAGFPGRARRALDIGCGAGLSTAALGSLAANVTGVEPVAAMLAHCRVVAPEAGFVVGTAERLPFAGGLFDLVTAAGALNYSDLPVALAEASRVLTPHGKLFVYDFSEARHAAGVPALADWFAAFEQRYPWPPGWRPLDPRSLPLAPSGLRLLDYAALELRRPTTFEDYLRYTVTGLNVTDPVEARAWCSETLAPIFAAGPITALIPAYIATLGHA